MLTVSVTVRDSLFERPLPSSLENVSVMVKSLVMEASTGSVELAPMPIGAITSPSSAFKGMPWPKLSA